MGEIRKWAVSLALLIAFCYHQTWICEAGGVPLKAHNLIPRFKIPHGNLSFYQNPHWEILYFLKYGTFPYTAHPNFNQTRFINKLQQIKRLLEKNPDTFGTLDDMNYGQGYDGYTQGGQPNPLTLSNFKAPNKGLEGLQFIDPAEQLFSYHGPLSFLPSSGEQSSLEMSHPPPDLDGNEELNELINGDPVTTAFNRQTKKADPLLLEPEQKQLVRALESVELEGEGKGRIDPDLNSFKNFLMEHDPSWVRPFRPISHARQEGYSPGATVIGAGRNYLIRRPMLRSGGSGNGGATTDDGSGAGARTGAATGGRKFQTQGW